MQPLFLATSLYTYASFFRIIFRDTSPNDWRRTGLPNLQSREFHYLPIQHELSTSLRRKKNHIHVNDRQVRGHRRHGQELLPFP